MSATVVALSVTLVIVLVIASVLITLLYVQLRQKRAYHGAVEAPPLTPAFGIFNFIPPWHPAAQITPFGSSPLAPVFKVDPGTNMRIAHRNSQGGWEFFDSGLPESGKLPRPQSVRSSMFTRGTPLPSTPSTPEPSHWSDSSSSPSREALARGFLSTAPPPPAYCKDEKR